MPILLSDARIAELVAEMRPFPDDFRSQLGSTAFGAHARSNLSVRGTQGTPFRIAFRRSMVNPLNFSVLLIVELPAAGTEMRLRRYNGKSHRHRNVLENGPFFDDYHIHEATERYQMYSPRKPDEYAEVTNRYADLRGAFDCMVADCNCTLPPPEIQSLFGDEFLR